MPPELMELYNLYKQELETRSTKENQFVEELDNQIIRVGTRPEWSNLACIFISENLSLPLKVIFLQLHHQATKNQLPNTKCQAKSLFVVTI